MSRSGIVSGGNWIVDRVKLLDRYPEQETLANISEQSDQNGGAPFNVLMDLTKLGATFPLTGIGVVGDDSGGRFIRHLCDQNGIDVSRLVTSTGGTSFTDVMTGPDGRRTFFHFRGANAELDVDHFDFQGLNAKHFHLGYLLLLDRLDRLDAADGTRAGFVLRRAQEAGMTTSVDIVSDPSADFSATVLPTLPQVDVCFLNEFELRRVTGIAVDDRSPIETLREATQVLFAHGLRQTAVVHTARYSFALDSSGEHYYRQAADVPSNEIKGCVGAGDAFAAGFLLALHEDKSVDECLRWGTAAAASSLLGAGASDAVLPIQEALVRFQTCA